MLLTGPGGMGKTHLLRWLDRAASDQGFQVRWGTCLKEAVAPFFAFEQVFRRVEGREEAVPHDVGTDLGGSLPPFLLIEEDRPTASRTRWSAAKDPSLLLVVSRDSASTLAFRGTPLPPAAHLLRMSRIGEEDCVPPGQLDLLGERTSAHLRRAPGSIVSLEGAEYLVSQNTFAGFLQLVQYLRDVAQESGGHLVLSLNPEAFDPREVSRLEAEAEVLRLRRSAKGHGPDAQGADRDSEPPAATLLRYLGSLESSAARAPQLVVLDDLHWADPSTGLAFQFLARNCRDLPVLLVGAARGEEVSEVVTAEGTSLGDRLESMERDGVLERLVLTPFLAADVYALAARVLGSRLAAGSDPEVSELLRRTEGNPYFLRETLLQLREDGALRVAPGGELRFERSRTAHGPPLRLPTSLKRLVLRRLSALSPEDRGLLATAAAAGSIFDVAPVAAVLGRDAEQVEARFEELSTRHRLLERAGGDRARESDRWEFSHPLVWEATWEELGVAGQRREARRLFAWWSEVRSDEVESLAALGHATGDPALGRPWLSRAFGRAMGRAALETASTYLLWAADLRRSGSAPMDRDLLEEEVGFAWRVAQSGGGRLVRPALERLLSEPLPSSVRWEATSALVSGLLTIDSEEAARVLDGLGSEIARAGDAVPSSVRHRVEAVTVSLKAQQDRNQETLDHALPLLAIPPEEIDPDLRAMMVVATVNAQVYLGRPVEAEALLRAETPRLLQLGDMGLARVENLRMIFARLSGDEKEAIRAGRAAQDALWRAGRVLGAGIAEYNLGGALVELGRLEEADGMAERLLDLGKKFDMPRLRCSGSYLRAEVLVAREAWAEARPWSESALRDAESMKREDDLLDCRVLHTQVRGHLGELDTAVQALQQMDRDGAFSSPANAAAYLEKLADLLELQGAKEESATVWRRALEASRVAGYAHTGKVARDALSRLGAAAE